MDIILVIGGFVLVIGLTFYWLIKKDAKRTSELKSIAERLGLTFVESDDPSTIKQKFQPLPVFTKGNEATVSNLMKGQIDDFEVWVCDYDYWGQVKATYGGKDTHISSSHKERQTLICLLLPDNNLPAFDITLKLKIGSQSAYDHEEALDFEKDSEFGKKYIVCAAPETDKPVLKDLLNPELQAMFTDETELKLQVGENKMALTNYRVNIETRELERYINAALSIVKSLN